MTSEISELTELAYDGGTASSLVATAGARSRGALLVAGAGVDVASPPRPAWAPSPPRSALG